MSRIITLLCLFLFVNSAKAQKITSPSIGIYIYGGIVTSDIISSAFELPTNPPPEYMSSDGGSLSLGFVYGLPISKTLSLNLRAGYVSFNAHKFSITHNANRENLRYTSLAETEIVCFEPTLGILAFSDFYLHAGVSFGYALSSRYTLTTGSYAGLEKQSTSIEKDFIQSEKFIPSATIGASYDFTLSEKLKLYISPEIIFSMGMVNKVNDKDWNIKPFRFGISFKRVFN